MSGYRNLFAYLGVGRRQSGKTAAASDGLREKRSHFSDACDLKSGRLSLIIGEAASGAPVNERTSLGVPAVTACVNLLADMVAKLPIYLYRENGKVPIEITDHPAIRVISKNSSELHTSFELRHLMETGRGLGGNGYARVYRNGAGDPVSLQWIKPCDVMPELIQKSDGAFVRYKITGIDRYFTRYDIIHVRGFCSDGLMGLSPLQMLRQSIGTAISQTETAGKLMKNGAKWPGFMTIDGVNDSKKLAEIRDEINSNMTGVMNAGRIPVVGGSLKFQQTNGMSMVDAEFIESRRFELQEIARLYRIPPFMIGDSTASTTWGTGIEQQTLGFLNFCLDSHLVGWEQSLGMTLLTAQEINDGYFFKFDRDELINAALGDRGSFYQTMRNIGVYSANDVRAKLGESLIAPEDGGDDYGKPFNASGGTPQPGAAGANPAPIEPKE